MNRIISSIFPHTHLVPYEDVDIDAAPVTKHKIQQLALSQLTGLIKSEPCSVVFSGGPSSEASKFKEEASENPGNSRASTLLIKSLCKHLAISEQQLANIEQLTKKTVDTKINQILLIYNLFFSAFLEYRTVPNNIRTLKKIVASVLHENTVPHRTEFNRRVAQFEGYSLQSLPPTSRETTETISPDNKKIHTRRPVTPVDNTQRRCPNYAETMARKSAANQQPSFNSKRTCLWKESYV